MSTSVQKPQHEGDDMLTAAVILPFKVAWMLLIKAPAFTVWAVIAVLMLHPWRGIAWGPLFTVLLPVLVVLTVASIWVRFLRHLLPWGDVMRAAGSRETGPVLDPAMSKTDQKLARLKAKHWKESALLAGIAQETTDDKGRQSIHAPRLSSIELDPLGLAFTIDPMPGQTVQQIIDAAPRFESGWGNGREIRAHRVTGTTQVVYTWVLHDPLEGTRSAALDAPQGWLQ